jgi:hypothetical protein
VNEKGEVRGEASGVLHPGEASCDLGLGSVHEQGTNINRNMGVLILNSHRYHKS